MLNTRILFNDRAAAWDSCHIHDFKKIRMMLALAGLTEGLEILDVGCGTGILEPFLLRYRPRRILAVDFADKMIDVARQKVSDARVEFLCADVFTLKDDRFDCCFLYNAYPHFPDPKRLLAHLASLIRPGGRLTISHNRGRTGSVCHPPSLHGQAAYPNRALTELMHPRFQVDASVDNDALFLLSAIRA